LLLIIRLLGVLVLAWSFRTLALETYYQYGERPGFGYWLLLTPIIGDIIWWTKIAQWNQPVDLAGRYKAYQEQLAFGTDTFKGIMWSFFAINLLILSILVLKNTDAFVVVLMGGFIGAIVIALYLTVPTMVYILLFLQFAAAIVLSFNINDESLFFVAILGALGQFHIHPLFFPNRLQLYPSPNSGATISEDTPHTRIDMPDVLDSNL